ncbi:MAG TPA: twin-arginine translocase TatA/TatE family subunit [Acidimicrobiia bacterium]|nr:twin-arginine translocase TatA/TatE family subunit [Acidimicrobiia bacterium]
MGRTLFIGEIIGPDILIILAIVMVLFGSTKIPKLARSLGQASHEFRKGLGEGVTDHIVTPLTAEPTPPSAPAVAAEPAPAEPPKAAEPAPAEPPKAAEPAPAPATAPASEIASAAEVAPPAHPSLTGNSN